MTSSFSERWEGEIGGLKGALKSPSSLKDRLNRAIRRIELQLNRVNEYIEYYNRRERELMEKIVETYEQHNDARAKIIANELSEVRKHKSLLITSKISLDKTVLRLRTIYEFGNFMSVISSAKMVVNEISRKISNIAPEINSELLQVGELLNEVMIDVGRSVGENLNFNIEDIEAEKILEEAAMVAKSIMNEKLFKTSRDKPNKGDYEEM